MTPGRAPLFVTGAAVLHPTGGDGDGPRRLRPFELRVPLAPAALRRLGRLSRLALHVAHAALEEAGGAVDGALGLVVGTALADLDETLDFLDGVVDRGPHLASPQRFQRSVHGTVAGELAIVLGATGYIMTVTEGLHSGELALFQAALALHAGRCERCLVVAVDGVADRVAAQLARSGAPAGEGAAAIVLERVPRADRALARLESVSPAAAAAPPADVVAEHGLHGALGLVRAVMALRSPNYQGCPESIVLGPA